MRMQPLAVLAAALAILAGCQQAATPQAADLVLRGGYIYTVDASKSVAAAVAVRGNSIVFVGSDADVAAFIGDHTVVRELDGAMVMPGIHDMHIHAMGSVEPDMCDLNSSPLTLEQMVTVLQSCIKDHNIAPGEWLIVLQWPFSQGNQPSVRLPTLRAALDAASTEHPIFLWGDDGHHGAANSAALAMGTTPDGAAVSIDAKSLRGIYADFRPLIAVDEKGEPTGGVTEDARMLVRPDFMADMLGTSSEPEDMMPRIAAKMAANGITSLQDPLVTPDMLPSYIWLENSGQMTFRLRAAFSEPENENIDDIDAHLELLKSLRQDLKGSKLIEANAVKLFADGVLEGNPFTQPPTLPVAAMLEPFKQPIFGGSLEDGSFDIIGYVDTDRDVCKSVQTNPDAYNDVERISSFKTEFGFFPQQCVPQSGVLEHDEAYIRSYIRKATEAGFHVHVHALADKGIRVTVDEFAKVKDIADRNGLTQSLAHVQIAHPDDQKRIGELGVSVVFTFVWATPGVEYAMMVTPFIDEIAGVADIYNPETYSYKNSYPAASIQNFGGNLVNGSDTPVGGRDPIPFVSLQQAILRSGALYGEPELVWNEAQRIDVHAAIAAFTINGATLFGHADQLGSIEVGKIADLVVLNQNIVTLAENGEAHRISETFVDTTVFDGQIVYEREQEASP